MIQIEDNEWLAQRFMMKKATIEQKYCDLTLIGKTDEKLSTQTIQMVTSGTGRFI
jgi:hypothetical protein